MKTILVIDDNKALNFIISTIFTRENYGVESVYLGLEGLELLEQKEFDVLITDMNLPDISGVEILAKVKDRPMLKLLVAAYCDDDVLKEIKSYDTIFIEKPFKNSELLQTVQKGIK